MCNFLLMRRLVVFFSWQSDIPDNHSTIKSGLEKACKKLSQELDCEVIYDESLRGELGSPQIEGVVVKRFMIVMFCCGFDTCSRTQ